MFRNLSRGLEAKFYKFLQDFGFQAAVLSHLTFLKKSILKWESELFFFLKLFFSLQHKEYPMWCTEPLQPCFQSPHSCWEWLNSAKTRQQCKWPQVAPLPSVADSYACSCHSYKPCVHLDPPVVPLGSIVCSPWLTCFHSGYEILKRHFYEVHVQLHFL